MTESDKKYLVQLIEEVENSLTTNSDLTLEVVNDICYRIDNISFPLNENSYADITSSVIWSIIDILMIWIPGGIAVSRTAKGMAKTGAKGVKQAIQYFRQQAKVVNTAIKTGKMGKMGKAVKSSRKGSLYMLAATILSCLHFFEGTPWEKDKIGAREKLPLVGAENLNNAKRKINNTTGNVARTVGMFFEPLNSIGEYTDKLRNAARALSNQVLKSEQEALMNAIPQEKSTMVGQLWAKVVGTIKNVFANPNTSTDSVYYPEFFDLCKERGIDTNGVAQIMGAEYRSLLTKTYGKQIDSNALELLIQQNVQNAANWFHLNAASMAQGAKIQIAAQEKKNNAQRSGQNRVQPETISQFQTWSQNMFTDSTGQPLVADGKIGPKTQQVIRQFQQWANQNGYSNNMPVDGLWGPKTAAAFQLAIKNGGDAQNKSEENKSNTLAVQNNTSQMPTSQPQPRPAMEPLPQINAPTAQATTQNDATMAENTIRFKSILEKMDYIKNNGSILLV